MTDEQRGQTGWIGVQEWEVILGRALNPKRRAGAPVTRHKERGAMEQNILIIVIVILSLIISTTVALVIIRKQRAKQKRAFARLPGELKELKSGKTPYVSK